MESETLAESVNVNCVNEPEASKPTETEKHNGDIDTDRATKKVKITTSEVWNNFTKIGIKDGKEKAKCNGCGQEYVIGGTKIGTSTLLRHQRKCKLIPKYHDLPGMMIDHAGKLRAREIDQKRVREVISMAIIEHGLPFNFVEYKWIRELHSMLNMDVKHISRNTAVADIWKFHLEQKEKLKFAMHRSRNRICLTSDCWTAFTQEGYICLTAHFVDNGWNLNSKILAFCKLEPPHSGYEMAKKILECLHDWGIDRKIFSITLDNASANDNLQDILIDQLNLQNSLLCEGEFVHVRCSAHVLNIIVQEGLKVASVALHKIRESIKYVRASEARRIAFKECVILVRGIDTKVGLRMDVSTRWNSTFVMLESALKYRRAFGKFTIKDSNYKHCPSNDEWKRAERMCDFLKPFYIITNLFSGTSYPTSNRYFMQVWKIECLLRQNAKSDDMVIKDMAARMLLKFEKYWSDYSVILAIAAILDPRMKFNAIQFCYSKLDSSTCEEKISYLKAKIYKLYEDYVKERSNESSASNSQSVATTQQLSYPVDEQAGDAFDEYVDYVSQHVNDTGRSELDLYLEEAVLDPKFHEKLDVLLYWKDRRERCPNLSRMACDVLSIPITTVASESAFSIGSRVLNKYHCSLLPDNVQALILTRNWLHGYNPSDEDVEDETDELVIDLAVQESNVLDGQGQQIHLLD